MKYRSISIVTCTLNSNLSIFKKMLDSIKMQHYEKKLIEHIIVDGGSTNGTLKLAQKYQCKIFSDNSLKEKGQVRASIGIKKSKGDLVLILESDNILTSENWLLQMVEPFMKEKDLVCTFSAYNDYEKGMSITTRYSALFGSPEPTLYYLKKTEKIRMDQKNYNKGKVIKETKNYWIVKFNQENLPTIGDNGHMFLRSAINKVNKNSEDYIHVDAFRELLDMKYDKYGVVKNTLIHINNNSVLHVMQRRVEVKEDFYNGRMKKRKYFVYNPQSVTDRLNLFKYVVYSFSFIVPLYESFRGFLKIHDSAWFLHPIMCLVMVFGYGYSEVSWVIKEKLPL